MRCNTRRVYVNSMLYSFVGGRRYGSKKKYGSGKCIPNV
jgi:hypothetical protein